MAENEKMTITEKILCDANAEAEKILADAEEKAKTILEEAKLKADEIDKDEKALSDKECEDVLAWKRTLGRIDANKQLLNAKQEILGNVYERAILKLKKLPKKDYLEFVNGLLKKYAEQNDTVILAKGSPVSVSDVESLEIFKSLNLKAEDNGNFDGGLVLSGAKFDKDLTFNSIIMSLRESTETEISSKLFGKPEG